MAVYKKWISNHLVVIHNTDHHPPHCHIQLLGRDKQVSLDSLEILNPPPNNLPVALRKGLLLIQPELIASWKKVHLL